MAPTKRRVGSVAATRTGAGDPAVDPALVKRRLCAALRKEREKAGHTQAEVAKAMDWSPSKVIRIESGSSSISLNDLRVLLQYYGLSQAESASYFDMARAAKDRRLTSWWSPYADLISHDYAVFLSYEQGSRIIRNFEPLLVPGLLQIEEYAQAVLSTIRGSKDDERIAQLVDLRLERQHRSFAAVPKDRQLNFIMDEAVIRRMVGGPDVTRLQLEHLLACMERPEVKVRVIPFSQGFYRSLRVPFVHFEFGEEDDDILYLEYPQGEQVVHENMAEPPKGTGSEPTNPTTYLEIFWEMEQLISRDESRKVVERALGDVPG